jgi:hypothetical protein
MSIHTRSLVLGASLVLVASCALNLGATSARGGEPGSSGEAAASPIRELVVVEARAGLPVASAMAPPWCATVGPLQPESDGRFLTMSMASLIENRGGELKDTRTVASMLCIAPDDDKVRAQTGYLVQYWINLTGATPDQIVSFLGSVVDSAASAEAQRAQCAKLPETGDAAAILAIVFGCSADAPFFTYVSTFVSHDEVAFADLSSELARAHLVAECFAGWRRRSDESYVGKYAACTAEHVPLDAAKLEEELAPWNEWARMVARITHARARQYQTEAAALAAR